MKAHINTARSLKGGGGGVFDQDSEQTELSREDYAFTNIDLSSSLRAQYFVLYPHPKISTILRLETKSVTQSSSK